MNNSLVKYSGTVNDDVRSQLQEFLQAVAAGNIAVSGSLKRLLTYALELLDNAQRYATGKVNFQWLTDGNDLIVVLSNEATVEDSSRLQSVINQIMVMDKSEIDDAYRKQLLNMEFGEKGGAGLGYLLMAKKGFDKMSLEIEPLNSTHNFCTSTIQTRINN